MGAARAPELKAFGSQSTCQSKYDVRARRVARGRTAEWPETGDGSQLGCSWKRIIVFFINKYKNLCELCSFSLL